MAKKLFTIFIVTFVITFIIAFIILRNSHKDNDKPSEQPKVEIKNEFNDFDFKIIKNVTTDYNENFLVSPLSIAYALNMLSDAATGNTKIQIEKVLDNYKLSNIKNIDKRLSLANALFVKNSYAGNVREDYLETIKTKYNGDIIFDDFNTPDVVNNYVSEKTFNMINNAVDKIGPETIFILANALAIDVEWNNKFECNKTSSDKFKMINQIEMDAAYMHSSNDVTYISNDKAEGIIKDYKTYDGVSLEYIAILPKTDITFYMNDFDGKELTSLLKNKKNPSDTLDINLSIPKYTYDFNYSNFKNALKSFGIVDAFDSTKANFNYLAPDIYVSDAIHKSHIELSESGTKAAAVTIFTFDKNAIIEKTKETINISFNKPFLYLIKEKNNNNIWFAGIVYEPMKFEDNTCDDGVGNYENEKTP